MNVTGATTEVATLKEALSKAEDNAAMERIEREKQEARVAEDMSIPHYHASGTPSDILSLLS